jgi:hypothetical protein
MYGSISSGDIEKVLIECTIELDALEDAYITLRYIIKKYNERGLRGSTML